MSANSQYLVNTNWKLEFADLSNAAGLVDHSVSEIHGNNIYHLTYSNNSATGTDVFLKKHSKYGTELWEATYNIGADHLYPEDVEWILEESALDIKEEGYDDETGWGHLDAFKSLQMLQKPNFTLFHYKKKVAVNMTAIETDKRVSVNGRFENIMEGRNYKVDIYKVTATFEEPWPEDATLGEYKIVSQQLSNVDVSRHGCWPLQTQSEAWGYNSTDDEILPFDGVKLSYNPYKMEQNGESLLKAELTGYFYFVRKRWWSLYSINKWYPFNPTNENVKMAFTAYFTQDWPLGYKDRTEKKPKFGVYPNPVNSNKIYIDFERNDNLKNLKICDLSGKVLIQKSVIVNREIDVSSLKPGMYLINLQDERSNSFSDKIVKY